MKGMPNIDFGTPVRANLVSPQNLNSEEVDPKAPKSSPRDPKDIPQGPPGFPWRTPKVRRKCSVPDNGQIAAELLYHWRCGSARARARATPMLQDIPGVNRLRFGWGAVTVRRTAVYKMKFLKIHGHPLRSREMNGNTKKSNRIQEHLCKSAEMICNQMK